MWDLLGKLSVAATLATAAWAAGSAVYSWYTSASLPFIGSLKLHASFFSLLACILTSLAIVGIARLVPDQVRRLLPRNRLHDLAPEARRLRSELENVEGEQWPPLHVDGEIVERLFTLQRQLTGLGIKSPDMRARNSWLFWLPLVASWAETKSLRSARKNEPSSLDEPTG